MSEPASPSDSASPTTDQPEGSVNRKLPFRIGVRATTRKVSEVEREKEKKKSSPFSRVFRSRVRGRARPFRRRTPRRRGRQRGRPTASPNGPRPENEECDETNPDEPPRRQPRRRNVPIRNPAPQTVNTPQVNRIRSTRQQQTRSAPQPRRVRGPSTASPARRGGRVRRRISPSKPPRGGTNSPPRSPVIPLSAKPGTLSSLRSLTHDKRLKKVTLSNTDIALYRLEDYCDADYLYLRNTQMRHFDIPPGLFYSKLVLIDVSVNHLSDLLFLSQMPHLRHVFASCNSVKSFRDVVLVSSLESIGLSENRISSFEGFGPLKDLRVLNLMWNRIRSLVFFPRVVNLDTINLIGCPICYVGGSRGGGMGGLDAASGASRGHSRSTTFGFGPGAHHSISSVSLLDERDPLSGIVESEGDAVGEALLRLLLLCVARWCCPQIRKINSVVVSAEERRRAWDLDWRLGIVLRMGYLPEGEIVEMLLWESEKAREKKKEGEEGEGEEGKKKKKNIANEDGDRIDAFGGRGRNFNESEPEEEGEVVDKVVRERDLMLSRQIEDFIESLGRAEAAESQTLGLIMHDMIGDVTEGRILSYAPVFRIDADMDFTGDGDEMGRGRIRPFPGLVRYRFVVNSGAQEVKVYFVRTSEDGSGGSQSVLGIGGPEIESSRLSAPLEMRKHPRKGEHYADILAPPGVYWYKFEYDGRMAEDENVLTLQENQDTMMSMMESPDDAIEEYEFFIDVNWYRYSAKDGLVKIEDAPRGCLSYTTSYEDVDCVIRPELTLTDFRHVMTPSISVFGLSKPIVACLPVCDALRIVGDPIDGQTLTTEYEYTGGEEGKCVVRFYREGDEPPPSSVRRMTEYVCGPDDIGHRIICEFVPIRRDGLVGEKVWVATSRIHPKKPVVRDVRIHGDLVEGEELTVSYVFEQGVEGNTSVVWSRRARPTGRARKRKRKAGEEKEEEGEGDSDSDSDRDTDDEDETEDEDASESFIICRDSLSYRTTLLDVGQIIEVEVTPRAQVPEDVFVPDPGESDDWRTGEPQHSPSHRNVVLPADPVVRALHLVCATEGGSRSPIEGEFVSLFVDYFGGLEGDSRVEWFRLMKRKKKEGEEEEEEGEGEGAPYEEIPIESPPVRAMHYRVTCEDIGSHIGVRYYPIREDGVAGRCVVDIIANPVVAAPPSCVDIRIDGDAKEGQVLSCVCSYFGGIEDKEKSKFLWYRFDTTTKTQSLIEESFMSQSHQITVEDVGYALVVEYVPVRKQDGVVSKNVYAAVTPNVVIGHMPLNINVHVVPGRKRKPFFEGQRVLGKAGYRGGVEKLREHRWFRVRNPGKPDEARSLIRRAKARSYRLKKLDVGKALVYSCRPTRADDVVGEWTDSAPSPVIRYMEPEIGFLTLRGRLTRGSSVTLIIQEKTEGLLDVAASRIEWIRLREGEEDLALDVEGFTYKFTDDDVGCKLKVRLFPARIGLPEVFGVPAVFITDRGVSDGRPRAKSVTIAGKCTVGSTIRADVKYAGAKEGNSTFHWFLVGRGRESRIRTRGNARSLRLRPEWINCRVKLRYTPMSFRGTKGKSVDAMSRRIRSAGRS